MRARYWLAIAETLHIPPWDLERLTYNELTDAVAYIDESARRMREADSKG